MLQYLVAVQTSVGDIPQSRCRKTANKRFESIVEAMRTDGRGSIDDEDYVLALRALHCKRWLQNTFETKSKMKIKLV